MEYRVALSRRSAAAGVAIVLGFLAASALILRHASTSEAETYIEQRAGARYLLVIGIASVVLACYFARGLAMAWPHRHALVAINDRSIEIQTVRGRRYVARQDVEWIGYVPRTKSMVVVDRSGRRFHPLLRPDGSNWSKVSAEVASIALATHGVRAADDEA